ncbi:MAG: hypothetical protein SFV53_00020 [Rickettsiales bacterium]|nr:hypothetical protein [Rickettsiales bacterium]
MISKKIKSVIVIILLAIIAIEISTVLANNLFFEKVALKEAEKRSMPKETSNAIKHAYAASLIYSTLRSLFLSENIAKNITIFLGKANEIAEIIFKPNQDSTLEMIKDLNNNLLGVCAGKWIEENSENPAMQERLAFIGNLAQRKKLFLWRSDVVLSEKQKNELGKSPSYFTAAKFFEENADKISCEF